MAKGNTIGSVFVRVRPRVVNFRREVDDKLRDEFSKPIELNVQAVLDTSKLDKDMNNALRNAGKKAKIFFDADFDGVDRAIKTLDRKLKDLRRHEVEFTANTRGIESAIQELEQRKRDMSKVTVEYTNDEAGYQKVLDQIQRIRDSKPTLTTTFKVDEESLNAAEAFARRKLREAKLKAPIEFTYSDTVAGRRSLMQHLEEIKRQRHEVQFYANLDDSQIDSKIRALRDQNVAVRAKFDLASAAVAEGQLAALARDRWVELKPRISKRAMATLQGSFMAIAGLNSIGHLIRQIEDIALNFDDMAVAGSAAGAAIGSLVSVGTVGLGALLNVARETLQAFQGLAMAPTLLLSGATAMQTWFAIWNDFGDAVEGDADALARIPEEGKKGVAAIQELDRAVNDAVQNNFWGEMTDEVERFTERIGPHVVEAMGDTAKVMGRTISSMIDQTEALSRNGSLDAFTKNNTVLMDQLGVAAETAFKALMEMGIAGSRYLPRLGLWVNRLSADFSKFIHEATRTGAFDSWITNSINSMQSLGRFAKSTWDMLAGVAKAFDNVDGAGLHEMADGMERIGNWVNSSGVQRRMEGIFRAAMDGASSAGRGFADLTKTIWDMEDAINSLLRQTGQLAGDFMTQISKIDFSVAIRGVTDLMDGMIDFVNMAGPGFESIANIFGRLGSIGGEVAREIAHGLNLTMGAIDGFIARVEGPLINAIHPLTRVFEDLAAMGTPVLFALADSVGVLLNAFAALPAPIQNVITLLAIMGRTGFGTAISKTVGHFTTMRTRVLREMQMLATQMPGYFNTAAGSVERRAMIMSQRVQAQMNTMRNGLRRAFGAGGLIGALGGGWGLAIAGIIGGLSAMAGASAEAEAAQRRLGETLHEVTGAMTEQTEVMIFDRLNKGFEEVDTFLRGGLFRGLGDSFDEEAQKIGLSTNLIVEEMTRSKYSADDLVDTFEQLQLAYAKGADTAELQALATSLGYVGDVSKITRSSVGEMQPVFEVVRDSASGLAEEIDSAYDVIANTGDGMRGVKANAEGFAPAVQELAGAFQVLGDDASTSAERVDALGSALERLGSKDALSSLELEVRAEEIARDVSRSIEEALATENIDYDNLFKGGELNPSSGHAGLVLSSLDSVHDEMLNRIDAAQQSMSESDFDDFLKDVPGQWEQRGREIAESLKIPEEHMKAFMDLWNSVEFDEHDIRFAYEGEAMMDKATQDFIRLKNAGMELDEDVFYARLGFEEGESFSKIEYAQALTDTFNETLAEANLSADSEQFQTMMDMAIESGVYFDGENFVAGLDADGQPAQEMIDAAEARGYAFDGQHFVAVADVRTDAASDALEAQINKANKQWNGQEFISMLNVDGTPTEEGLAHAQSLGLAWHNGRFVAVVDADGTHADAEITAARESALRYEGVYNAIFQTEVPEESRAAVAQAIADNTEFAGDYQALLDALQTESGKQAIEQAITDLEGVDKEVKTELITLFTGKAVIEEAKEDHVEIDNTTSTSKVDVDYDNTGAVEAKNDKAEIQGHPALSKVDSEYDDTAANEAKADQKEIDAAEAKLKVGGEYTGGNAKADAQGDAAEVENLNPQLEIGSEYTGGGTAEAKADASEIEGMTASYKITAEYDASTVGEAKADAAELDSTRARMSIDTSYASGGVEDAKTDAAAIDALSPTLDIDSDYSSSGAEDAKNDASEIDGLTAQWSISADSTASDQAVASVRQGISSLSNMTATPTISVAGADAVRAGVQSASFELLRFRASGGSATISLAGAGAVIAQAALATAALTRAQGTYVTRLVSVGGPQVVAMARMALAANQRVNDTFVTRLISVGGPQVIAMALLAYAAADRVDDTYTATFTQTGAASVVTAADDVRSAINSINLNPVVTFGGRVAASLYAAAASVVAAATLARAAAALSADGSLSNSKYKPRIEYFNNGGINFRDKPTRAHIAPAGQYVMYAERETGGEAFIPLAASKRQRSVAIWKETGRRLNVYADGDVTGGSSESAGGDVYHIITPQGATANDVINAIEHRQRRKRRNR